MKNTVGGILITVLAFFLVATPLWAQDGFGSKRQIKLYDYITKQNPYKKWSTWKGEVERLSSSGHHGTEVKKYVNDVAHDALLSGAKELPEGSIIVQENYSSWGLTSITVMRKEIRGFNPNADDWSFAMYSTNGTPLTDVRGKGCLSCHKAKGNTDLLLSAFPHDYGKSGMAVSSISSPKVN
jgi:hypothetical protein